MDMDLYRSAGKSDASVQMEAGKMVQQDPERERLMQNRLWADW